MGLHTVGDVAKIIGRGVRPQDITGLFYAQRLRDDLCPIVGGRRLIPVDYIDIIRMELRRAGKLPAIEGVKHDR